MADVLDPVVPGADDAAVDTSVDTNVEAADAAEDAEWEAALEEYAPGLKKAKEDEDEQPDAKKDGEEAVKEKDDSKDKESDEEPGTGDDSKKDKADDKKPDDADSGDDEGDDAAEAPDTSTRTARQTARDAAKQVEEFSQDVRAKMFANVPTRLQDGDGDPINSIEDVMKLVNPRTNEAFTEEEASMWLLSAQQQFNQNLAQIDKTVEQIATVNVDLRDEADSVNYQYGELLKAMPELRDQVWAEYEKTLVKDPETGIITQMPVSLERFYNITLQPYVKLAEGLEREQAAKAEAEKAQAEAQKVRTRTDRSDILGRGKVDDMDDDEKEWSEAFKSYYESK